MKLPNIFSTDIAFYNKIYFCAGLTLKQQVYKLGFNVYVLSPKLPEGSICVLFLFSDSQCLKWLVIKCVLVDADSTPLFSYPSFL